MLSWPDQALEQASTQFLPVASELISADHRRIVIVGAGGWVGRAMLALLHNALGPKEADRRIVCFGSSRRSIDIAPGLAFSQMPLTALSALNREPTILFHLAFLTKDKVGSISDADYVQINTMLSRQVLEALTPIGVDRLFVASSGAASFADDPTASHDLRLYGGLKRNDEELFGRWAERGEKDIRAVIARIYNISGPYINKHETYALASFILDALAGRTIDIRATTRVIRGYVAVRELLSLVFAILMGAQSSPLLQFDTGGEALELGNVARQVADIIGGEVRRPPLNATMENRYVGDDARYRELIGDFDIEHIPLAQQIIETATYLSRSG